MVNLFLSLFLDMTYVCTNFRKDTRAIPIEVSNNALCFGTTYIWRLLSGQLSLWDK
jgi:hypothetical protein